MHKQNTEAERARRKEYTITNKQHTVGPRYIVDAYHIKSTTPIPPPSPHELDDAVGITR